MRYYKIKKSDYEKCTSKELGILIALGKQIPDLSFEKMMELFINKQQILKVGQVSSMAVFFKIKLQGIIYMQVCYTEEVKNEIYNHNRKCNIDCCRMLSIISF